MSRKKFSIYFIAFIIFAKIVYLFFEIYYNIHLIDVVSSAKVTQFTLENLESLGHNISAVGITLLILPFIYLLSKRIDKKAFRMSLLVILTISSFFGIKKSLEHFMQKVVEENRDKGYSSYYLSAFKYAMLNEYMGYNSFIPKESLANLTIDDRVMISNIFILNYLDKSLIDRIIKRGQNHFTDIFIEQYHSKEYNNAKIKFEESAEKIANAYNKYIEKSKEINKKFSKVDNERSVQIDYKDFTLKLREKYEQYEKSVFKYEEQKNVSSSQVDDYYTQLAKYFKYQNNSKAKNEYSRMMKKKFGYYIEPNRWCGSYCPNRTAIRNVINEEAYKKWMKKSNGLSPTLGQKEFFKHPNIRKKVVKELRSKGLKVSNNFNYSYASFSNAYKNSVNTRLIKVKKEFYDKFYKESGVKVRFGLTYSQFVNLFKNRFYKEYGKKYGYRLLVMIKKKDTSDFYKKVYKPYFKTKYLSDYVLTEKQLNSKKYQERADIAVKNLYLAPFAITISLLTGILNLISLIAIIIFLVVRVDNYNNFVQVMLKSSVKLVLFVLIVILPFKMMEKSIIKEKYPILKEIKNENLKQYFEVLDWVLLYERFNYSLIGRK